QQLPEPQFPTLSASRELPCEERLVSFTRLSCRVFPLHTTYATMGLAVLDPTTSEEIVCNHWIQMNCKTWERACFMSVLLKRFWPIYASSFLIGRMPSISC